MRMGNQSRCSIQLHRKNVRSRERAALFSLRKKGGQVVGTLKSIEHIKLIAFKNTVET